MEFKRKNDHLHKMFDEEKEENKRKLIEVVIRYIVPQLALIFFIFARK